ncbi:MAG: serine/threonine protein kinase [Kofleriaceae bacterium]|nr:serine/threonine protein kinase [Kofleriaceae bacterium]
MGKVYRSLDTKTNTEVAIKVLTLDPSKYSRRFMREAKVMSRLKHKNIIEYLGYGQTEEGAPYIVMEWVQGEDLRQRMNRQAVSLDEALRIISGLGDALALADKQGIIHRDLKPSNLMLVDSKMDTIKLLDFGIARGSDPDLERMTKTGVSIGTPGYMAPEQSRGESKIDGRADIYALGCVVYETLVGQRPFRGEDIVAVLARGAIEEPPESAPIVRTSARHLTIYSPI